MSTRSIIARQLGVGNLTGFEGVYHHWDGYPSGIGATLYRMYHSLGANLESLLEEVIDKHTAGWVSLNETVLSKSECFCHRSEPDNGMGIVNNLDEVGAVYAYAFEKEIYQETDVMHIYLRTYNSFSRRWLCISSIDLTDSEPDWNVLDSRLEVVEPEIKDKQSSLQY